MKIKKICSKCGSEDVVVDAWIQWNEYTQEWEIYDIFDNCYCNKCEGECHIEDIEVKDENKTEQEQKSS